MIALMDLLRSRATVVWVALTGATVVSWALGTDTGAGPHRSAGTAILLLALMKARLIGLYFMELRDAPAALRVMFEGYCALVITALIAMYLAI